MYILSFGLPAYCKSLKMGYLPSSIGQYQNMVYIPEGKFFMGCQPDDTHCEDDEHPRRKVYISAYFIDETEVTVRAYTRCVRSGVCEKPQTGGLCNFGRADKQEHPVNCINWNQAKQYCGFLEKRLPTEAEWERAARSEPGDIYAWGREAPSSYRANYDRYQGDGTQVVRSYMSNRYGMFDVAGNVWEWVADCYQPDRYQQAALNQVNPLYQPDYCLHEARVLRGGSFRNTRWALRVSDRFWSPKDERLPGAGVRCVRAAGAKSKI